MKVFLVIHFVLFFSLAMIWPSYRIWKTTGGNPYKLGSSDSAHDYIGKLFRFIMIACFFVVLLFALFPEPYNFPVPLALFEKPVFIISGYSLLIFSLFWVLVAQVHMQKSWRIGIDEDIKTELIQTGLFKFSRNPIFLGMRTMLLGLFLVIPNVITLVILITGELLIQIQVRLEEEYLTRTHVQSYLEYKSRVPRWL